MKNKNTPTTNEESATTKEIAFAELGMNQDLKHSILLVSIVANLFILTAWIALQVTTQFDSQVAGFLFNR